VQTGYIFRSFGTHKETGLLDWAEEALLTAGSHNRSTNLNG
jgi:hypothetical protein